jgi:ferric iron reductase protein FhuF
MSVNAAIPSIPQLFGFWTSDVPEDIERLSGPMLTSPSQAEAMLDRFCRVLRTEKRSIAASQFTKWYCRSSMAVLYDFSINGIARSASLRDISVLFPGEPLIAVSCSGRAVPVTEAARESLRELTVIRLFAHNWNLVFKTLYQLTGLREDLMWENGSMYLHFFYREWIKNAAEPDLRARLEEDYSFIREEAPPELYGELQCFNPFQWTGKPVRSTCCLRCHLPEGNYCKGCPHSNPKPQRNPV